MPGFDFRTLVERARAENPDLPLFELIEADRSSIRGLNRALGGLRGASRREALQRSAGEALDVRDRLNATRPATLEGLLAKLRHVAGKTGETGIYAEYHAALNDAIAWLDPPEPERSHAAGKRRPATASPPRRIADP